jgi:hypothetical protein
LAQYAIAALTVNSNTISSSGNLILTPTSNLGIGNVNPQALLHVGTAGTRAGTIKVDGATSGTVTIQPAAAAGTWALTLPTTAGTNGQVLTTNGSGVTSWTTVAGGGVTNSAGANVIPKSDGTNLVASRITDDGTDIYVGDAVGATAYVLTNPANAEVSFHATGGGVGVSGGIVAIDSGNQIVTVNGTAHTISVDSGTGTTTIGDVNGIGNATKITLYDSAGTIDLTGNVTVNGSPFGATLTFGGSTFEHTVAASGTIDAWGPTTDNWALTSQDGNTYFTNAGFNSSLKTPSSSSAACTQGQIEWDANFVYVCIATNTWKRAGISTW